MTSQTHAVTSHRDGLVRLVPACGHRWQSSVVSAPQMGVAAWEPGQHRVAGPPWTRAARRSPVHLTDTCPLSAYRLIFCPQVDLPGLVCPVVEYAHVVFTASHWINYLRGATSCYKGGPLTPGCKNKHPSLKRQPPGLMKCRQTARGPAEKDNSQYHELDKSPFCQFGRWVGFRVSHCHFKPRIKKTNKLLLEQLVTII